MQKSNMRLAITGTYGDTETVLRRNAGTVRLFDVFALLIRVTKTYAIISPSGPRITVC